MRHWLFACAVILGIGEPDVVQAADDAVALGFSTALTGRYSAGGQRTRNAFEAAVEDLNNQGGVLGHRVEPVVVDDACGIERAAKAAVELVAAEVRAVVGHMCSHSSLMAASIYEAASVPMLTPYSTHPRLTEEGRSNVFRLIGRDDDQGAFVADLVARLWPESRIAILHDGSTYGEGLAREMRARLRWHGPEEILYQRYEPESVDYGALAASLGDIQAEIVLVGGYGPDAGLIVRAARANGLDVQFLGGDGLDMDGFWMAAGKAGEGTLFSDRPVPDVDQMPTALIDALKSRGVSWHPGELAAYATVQVWAEAVRRAGTFDLPAVARELSRGRFETVLGTLAFDAKGDLRTTSWELRAWSDGHHTPVTLSLKTQ